MDDSSDLPASILAYLSNHDREVSINQIAKDLSINRHSAAKYLTTLQMLGKVEHRPFGNIKSYRISHRVPLSAIRTIYTDTYIALDRNCQIKEIHDGSIPFFSHAKEIPEGSYIFQVPHPLFSDSAFLEKITQIISGKIKDYTEYWYNVEIYSLRIRFIPCVFDDGLTGIVLLISDFSDKKKTTNEIEMWKDKYYTLVREPFEMVIHLSPDKRITFANEQYLAYYQTTLDQVLGTDHFFQKVLSTTEKKEEYFRYLTPENPSGEFTSRSPSAGGQVHWKKWYLTGIFRDNELIEYQVSGSDITGQVEMDLMIRRYEDGSEYTLEEKNKKIASLEEELSRERRSRSSLEKKYQEREQFFFSFADRVSGYTWRIDKSGRFVDCSDQFASSLGYTSQELIGMQIYSSLSPDSILDFRLLVSQKKTGEYPCRSFEAFFISRYGQTIRVGLHCFPEFSRTGEYTGFFCVGKDISKDILIREEQERLYNLLGAVTDFIGISDHNGTFVYLNKSGRKMLDISEEKPGISYSLSRFVSTRFADTVQYGIDTAVKNGIWKGESVIKSLSGEEIPVHHVILSYRSSVTGQVTLSTILHDKRESMFHEREISQINAYYRSIIEATLDPMITMNLEGIIQDVNRAAEEITGQKRRDLIGTYFSGLLREPEAFRMLFEETINAESVRGRLLTIIHTGGRCTPVLYNATVFRNEMGKSRGILATLRDIGTVERDILP